MSVLYQNALVLGFLRCFLLLRFLRLGQEYHRGAAVLFPGTHHVCHIGKLMMSACLLTRDVTCDRLVKAGCLPGFFTSTLPLFSLDILLFGSGLLGLVFIQRIVNYGSSYKLKYIFKKR